MSISAENILFIGSILLFLSIIASRTSFRLGIPTLILFIIIGMLAGSDGFGGIYFDDPKIAQVLGVIALNFILFSGGMDTSIRDVRPVFFRGLMLSTVGVLVTAVTVGLFAAFITELSIIEGMLLGAIVSSTDAAAVFSILRTKKIGLKGSLRPILELESGSNDPMAYFLMLSLISLIQQPEQSYLSLIPAFFWQMIVGVVAGLLMGKGMQWTINKLKLDAEGLYPVLLLALMFFTFSVTNLVGGNGFLAVYISGIVLGNGDFIHKNSLIRFYDGQAWLMQIIMFLTLGLLVYPSQIVPLVGTGILLALFLIFVSRPLGVFLSLLPFRIKLRNRLFLSWVGLRGAVPIVFATYPLLEGLEHAQFIFNLVFFISLSSVLLQGTTLGLVARKLNVALPVEVRKRMPLEYRRGEQKLKFYFDLVLPANSRMIDKKLFQLNWPEGAFITAINRRGHYFMPDGNTVLQEGDHLYILAKSEDDKRLIESDAV